MLEKNMTLSFILTLIFHSTTVFSCFLSFSVIFGVIWLAVWVNKWNVRVLYFCCFCCIYWPNSFGNVKYCSSNKCSRDIVISTSDSTYILKAHITLTRRICIYIYIYIAMIQMKWDWFFCRSKHKNGFFA